MKAFNVKGQRQRINVAAALILGVDFLVMLAALMLALPPQSYDLSVVAPHIASAMLMTVFGPYLFVASGKVLLTMLLMVIHLVLLWALVNRVRFFDGFGRWSWRGRLLRSRRVQCCQCCLSGVRYRSRSVMKSRPTRSAASPFA